jgi:hypothetical protein
MELPLHFHLLKQEVFPPKINPFFLCRMTDLTETPSLLVSDNVNGINVVADNEEPYGAFPLLWQEPGIAPKWGKLSSDAIQGGPDETFVLTTFSPGVAVWMPPTGGAPSGNAGGALQGTYPNPGINLTSNSSIQGVLNATKGGTGQAITGCLFIGDSSGNAVQLPPGNVGQVLTIGAAGTPVWVYILPRTQKRAKLFACHRELFC